MASRKFGYVLFCTVFLVLRGFNPCDAARILLSYVRPIHTPSHLMGLSPICEKLVERGHTVTLLIHNNWDGKSLSPNAYTDVVHYNTPYSEADLAFEPVGKMIMRMSRMSMSERLGMMSKMRSMVTEGCVFLFKDGAAIRALKEARFDMVLTMPTFGCDVLVADYLGVPFTLVTLVRRMPSISEEHFGIPIPPSYVPFGFSSPLTDTMSFGQRMLNIVHRFVTNPVFVWYMTQPLLAIKDEFRLGPGLSLAEMVGRADLWLCQDSPALEFAQPTAPIRVPIPGITVKPSGPLPPELETFVQGAGHQGIVIFSLGSASSLDPEKCASMARVFGSLPQRVIWRHKGDPIPGIADNTLVSAWIPQNDLLGHPQTRLLIYHGGNNGVYEAVSKGVALLVLPMGMDRHANAARVAAKGLGVIYNMDHFSEDTFKAKLLDVLNNKSYTKNAQKASAIMNDQLAPLDVVAAFWIEHVIKFGANHMRLRASEMSFIELHSLDVVGVLVLVLATASWLLWWTCRTCYRCCRTGSNGNKPKKD